MKKCYSYVGLTLLFGVFSLSCFFLSFVSSTDVSAATVSTYLYGAAQESVNGVSQTNVFIPNGSPTPVGIKVLNGFNSYNLTRIDVSGSMASATGMSYNATITGSLQITGGYHPYFTSSNCSGITGKVFAEQGTKNGSKTTVSCEVSQNGTVLNFQINTIENLTSSTTMTSFAFHLSNNSNYLFSCSNLSGSMTSPCPSSTATVSLNLNSSVFTFSATTDPSIGYLQEITSQNETVISQNNQIIQNGLAAIDAINNQNQQQQDQYNQEKAEESEREEQGKSDSDQLAGIFSFSIENPFTTLFGAFTPGNSCVSIPTIAGMLGSEDTQYCPWFPATVRNVLTPVLSMFSIIIIFGFVVGWLNGNDANGSITIKGGVK